MKKLSAGFVIGVSLFSTYSVIGILLAVRGIIHNSLPEIFSFGGCASVGVAGLILVFVSKTDL